MFWAGSLLLQPKKTFLDGNIFYTFMGRRHSRIHSPKNYHELTWNEIEFSSQIVVKDNSCVVFSSVNFYLFASCIDIYKIVFKNGAMKALGDR
jgi:hypothetical protein